MSFFSKIFLVAALALSSAAWAAPVDINSADAKTLETLTGVGASKAAAIVEYRKTNGPFKSVDDLAKVKGIGEKLVEKNRENLTVGKAAAPAPATKAKTAQN
jgi:competence protein ComEA